MNPATNTDAVRPKGWLLTYTGIQFDLFHPRPEDVSILDIAHHLSMICRFGGAVRAFYSVAQHSVHVAELCPELAITALLHDAAEAYIGDMVRGLKHDPRMEAYRKAEARVHGAIAERFGIFPEIPWDVKHADEVMLVTEARDLMLGGSRFMQQGRPDPRKQAVDPWQPYIAEQEFLLMAARLGINVNV